MEFSTLSTSLFYFLFLSISYAVGIAGYREIEWGGFSDALGEPDLFTCLLWALLDPRGYIFRFQRIPPEDSTRWVWQRREALFPLIITIVVCLAGHHFVDIVSSLFQIFADTSFSSDFSDHSSRPCGQMTKKSRQNYGRLTEVSKGILNRFLSLRIRLIFSFWTWQMGDRNV